MTTPLTLASRASALAVAQAETVAAALCAAGAGEVRVKTYTTTGDKLLTPSLAQAGGKGLFTKEIEEALLRREADLAVHSMKDFPVDFAPALRIGAVPRREDPRDVFISERCADLASLPAGATIGSSSVRRKAFLLAWRKDLNIVPLRGNVGTRLNALREGKVDAILLARAGLNRLRMAVPNAREIPFEIMLPAVGQGALCVQVRQETLPWQRALDAINHADTLAAVTAERACLAALGGTCVSPVGCHAEINASRLRLRAAAASLDGSRVLLAEQTGPVADARALGDAAGRQLRSLGADKLW